MKKTVLIVAVLASACSPEVERVVVHTYPNGKVELEQYFMFKDSDSILVKEIGYYPDGLKRIEGRYLEGKREGRWTYWFDNGKKWSEAHYNGDVRHGMSTVWHKNGRKYYEGTFYNGERAGKWRFWDDAGNLMKEVDYD